MDATRNFLPYRHRTLSRATAELACSLGRKMSFVNSLDPLVSMGGVARSFDVTAQLFDFGADNGTVVVATRHSSLKLRRKGRVLIEGSMFEGLATCPSGADRLSNGCVHVLGFELFRTGDTLEGGGGTYRVRHANTNYITIRLVDSDDGRRAGAAEAVLGTFELCGLEPCVYPLFPWHVRRSKRLIVGSQPNPEA